MFDRGSLTSLTRDGLFDQLSAGLEKLCGVGGPDYSYQNDPVGFCEKVLADPTPDVKA
jgi:hypothetical protein